MKENEQQRLLQLVCEHGGLFVTVSKGEIKQMCIETSLCLGPKFACKVP